MNDTGHVEIAVEVKAQVPGFDHVAREPAGHFNSGLRRRRQRDLPEGKRRRRNKSTRTLQYAAPAMICHGLAL